MALSLKSSAFAQGRNVPRKYTCDGMNVSPPLEWSGVPAGTTSLLLICNDPDAPGGTFHHWAAYDIPPDLKGLEEIPAGKQDRRFRQAVNDFGQAGYGGPCPPGGHKPHSYRFRLSALKERLEAEPATARCTEIIRLAKPLEIGAAELVGYYGRM
jgi:Raf kinase inhibitor-like YbhB/YbcL family protein